MNPDNSDAIIWPEPDGTFFHAGDCPSGSRPPAPSKDAPSNADPFGLSWGEVSDDARILGRILRSTEPVPHPLTPELCVCQLPTGTLVLTELAGSHATQSGLAIRPGDAVELAMRILGGEAGKPGANEAWVLALAYMGLLMSASDRSALALGDCPSGSRPPSGSDASDRRAEGVSDAANEEGSP